MIRTAAYSDITSRNAPSFYAPPAAWATAQFVQALLDEEDGDIDPHRTGLIVASDTCSLPTIAELSRTAAQGKFSPLRFAGASPSIVAGLPALEQGIRGPTLCLTMPPVHAARPILALIRYWLAYGDVRAVIAVAHLEQGRQHHFNGLIARSTDAATERQVKQLANVGHAD